MTAFSITVLKKRSLIETILLTPPLLNPVKNVCFFWGFFNLTEKHWEVCLHSLRLLQSVLLEEDLPLDVQSSLLDPDLLSRVTRLASSAKPSLKLTAQQTMEDLQGRQQAPQRTYTYSKALKSKAFKRKTVYKNR